MWQLSRKKYKKDFYVYFFSEVVLLGIIQNKGRY